MTYDIATCMYYTGIDNQRVGLFCGQTLTIDFRQGQIVLT